MGTVVDNLIDSPSSFADWIMPWPEFIVDWARAALVMVDCQNYACNPTCGLQKMIGERQPEVAAYYGPRVLDVAVPNARRLLTAFRESRHDVIYTRHGPWLPDGRDMIARRRRRDAASVNASGAPQLWGRGTFEYEIIETLSPLPAEIVIDKNCSSPFNGTGIDQILRNLELETLVLTGTATDMCVETTARDAADRGYNVIVVDDATATFFAKHHVAALSALARVYAQVWDTQRVLREMSGTQGVPSCLRTPATR
jgi:nicotinamidase-related amidase